MVFSVISSDSCPTAVYHKLSGPGVNEPGDLAVQSTSRAVKNWIESEWHT